MPRHRIFIAIGIPKTLQLKISEWRGNFSRKRSFPTLRWLSPENLHITLIPPWYEDERGLQKIKEHLEKFTFRGPFKISFHKISYGPDPKRPRLIWLEGRTPKQIVELKTELEKILSQKSEARPFKVHLTIARFRSEAFSSFPIKKIGESISWSEQVKSFLIMESHLSPSGAQYSKFLEIPIL